MKTDLPLARLWHWNPWQKGRIIQQVAGEVARQCRVSLWQRVCEAMTAMSVSEIRGYVRARAASLVNDEVELACMRRQLAPSLRRQVAASAIDQLIVMVIRDVLCEQAPGDVKTMAA
jgi:hypothetical protein